MANFYQEWRSLTILPSKKEMMRQIEKGRQFVVMGGGHFREGTIVSFSEERNDNTFFKDSDGIELEKFSSGLALLPEIGLIQSTNASNIMSSLLTFFRNFTLSQDDKILIEMGLENPTGVPTQEYKELALEMVYNDMRPKIIALAKQKKEEEDAAKK